MKTGRLFINTIWYGVVPKLPQVVTLLTLPFVTPYLTPFDYGVLGIINSYRGIADGFVGLGLGIHLQNSFFEIPNHYKLLWRRIYFYMFVTSFLASILLVFLYFFNLPINSLGIKVFVIVLSILPLFLAPVKPIVDNYYVLRGEAKSQVIRNVTGAIINILTAFIIIRYLNWGYLGWVIGLAIGTLVTFLLFLKPLLKDEIYPQIDFNLRRIKNLLKVSLPIIPHGFGQVIFSSGDRIVMTILSISVADIGLYTNGVSIASYPEVVVTGLFIALVPTLQKSYRAKDTESLKYYYRLSNILVSVAALTAALFMNDFYQIFIRNEALQPASEIAVMMCFSFIFKLTFYNFMMTCIYIEKKTKYVLYLVFYPSILNILLNFTLINCFGYIGAVYSTIFCSSIIILLPFVNSFFRKAIHNVLGNMKYFFECLVINFVAITIACIFFKEILLYRVLVGVITLTLAFLYFWYSIKSKQK